ncbi:hypothetical protein LPJ61_004652, partial [Coemansia biformis]
DVYDFVNNVDSLRKHFKWSNQVTYCYARTMLKGSARKTVQTARSAVGTGAGPATSPGGSSSEQQKSKALGDEAIDPNSWGNLRAALVFEFSEQFAQDRAMMQLLTIRQQAGESGSEYTQRFVGLVSALVAVHPLDTNLLAVLFAAGLRSEKTRWDLLLRRLNTIDKAVGYVAPDQLYKVAKLTSLLSPLPATPATVDSTRGQSPASEGSASFAARVPGAHTFVDEAVDELDVGGMCISDGAGAHTQVMRGSTANGASFALDSDDKPAALDGDDNGHWSPPRLPDAQQRRLHRRNMAAHARMGIQAASSVAGAQPAERSWAHRSATVPHDMDAHHVRGEGAQSPAGSGSETDDQMRSAAELNSLADQLESLTVMLRTQSDARRRRPRLCYRCRQKGHMAVDCPLPADVAVPNQLMRERMGLTVSSTSVTLPRSHTLSSFPTPGTWRAAASPVAAAAAAAASAATVSCSSGRGGAPPRRSTQSWGRNGPPSTAAK